MGKKVFYGFVLILIGIEFFLLIHTAFFYKKGALPEKQESFLKVNPVWADTLIKRMNINEKIAQLILLKLNAVEIKEKEDIQNIVKNLNPGGILFENTGINSQILLGNAAQSSAKIPLLIASKGGIINQTDFNFPAGIFFNAITDTLFRDLYMEKFAGILSAAQVKIDFSARFNKLTDKDNLCFSDNQNTNIQLALKWNNYLKKQKIVACIDRFDEFVNKNNPADSIYNNILKNQLKNFNAIKIDDISRINLLKTLNANDFKGLIFSDWKETSSDTVLAKAIQSGINMFIVDYASNTFVKKIRKLISSGVLKEKDLDKNIRKILLTKTKLGLNKAEFLSAEQRMQQIFTTENKKISWQIYEQSATLVKNKKQTVPIKDFSKVKVCFYASNKNDFDILKQSLRYYIDFYTLNKLTGKKYYSHLILAFHPADSLLLKNASYIETLKKIAQKKKLIIINFASPLYCKQLNFADALIQLYDTHPFSQSMAAQIICGAITPKGKLPVKPNFDQTKTFKPIQRLQYTIPEIAGFDSYKLKTIDSIVYKAELMGAAPFYLIF